MPSHVSADRDAAEPPQRGTVDALISQTRRLRGGLDAVRREALEVDAGAPEGRWQRALYDLAVHHLNDLDGHLAQLRDGPAAPGIPRQDGPRLRSLPPLPPATVPRAQDGAPPTGSLLSRVGSAEWNLLTDEASWSGELYAILGRDPASPPLTLDELPSVVLAEDRPGLTAMVTDCLVDGKPIDGEFRIVRQEGPARTVHMMGEPVLAADGSTASMWAVLRDVHELRRSERAVRESGESLRRQRQFARAEHQLALELQESVLPPWRGPLRLPRGGPAALDLGARYLPSLAGELIGGDWYDALELPGGQMLLSVGDLTGHGVGVTSGMAMLLGALRGMALTGTEPGRLMGWLNDLLDASIQPALGSAVCCRYAPATRTLVWAQAGHPAPLLFRDGAGRPLASPSGVLLGATSGASYEQAEETLLPGDLLVLYTDGLVPGAAGVDAQRALLALAPRFAAAQAAQDGVRAVVEEFGGSARQDDACALIARIAG